MNQIDPNKVNPSEILWQPDGSIAIRGQKFVVRRVESDGQSVTLTSADLTPELRLQVAMIVNVSLKAFSLSEELPFSNIEYTGAGVILLYKGKEKVQEIKVDDLPDVANDDTKSLLLKLAHDLAAIRQDVSDAALEISNNNNNNNNNR